MRLANITIIILLLLPVVPGTAQIPQPKCDFPEIRLIDHEGKLYPKWGFCQGRSMVFLNIECPRDPNRDDACWDRQTEQQEEMDHLAELIDPKFRSISVSYTNYITGPKDNQVLLTDIDGDYKKYYGEDSTDVQLTMFNTEGRAIWSHKEPEVLNVSTMYEILENPPAPEEGEEDSSETGSGINQVWTIAISILVGFSMVFMILTKIASSDKKVREKKAKSNKEYIQEKMMKGYNIPDDEGGEEI